MIKEYTFDTSEYIIERSNKTIYGELYRPLTDKEKLPIIIICHGYNSCCEGVRYEAELLAKRGVASYCFDFCGGGLKTKSSGTPVEMTIRTEQNDLEEVIKEIENWQEAGYPAIHHSESFRNHYFPAYRVIKKLR